LYSALGGFIVIRTWREPGTCATGREYRLGHALMLGFGLRL
jgi:hypothetical protein